MQLVKFFFNYRCRELLENVVIEAGDSVNVTPPSLSLIIIATIARSSMDFENTQRSCCSELECGLQVMIFSLNC